MYDPQSHKCNLGAYLGPGAVFSRFDERGVHGLGAVAERTTPNRLLLKIVIRVLETEQHLAGPRLSQECGRRNFSVGWLSFR